MESNYNLTSCNYAKSDVIGIITVKINKTYHRLLSLDFI